MIKKKMSEKPNYYAIIPAIVRYNENLNSSQKLFYGEITSLTQKTGECWASNNYFSQLYGVSPSLISNWLRALENENLIIVEYEKNGKEITKRIIRLVGIQNIEYVFKELKGGIQNIEPNNTSINNTSKKEIYKERFKKPSLEDIKEYCLQRNNNVDAQKFFDYYEANNWSDSKGNKVKSWKQKVITWETHAPKHTIKEDSVPDWFNKNIETTTSKEEQNEMDQLIKELQE